MIPHNNIGVIELYEHLKETHPDKMLLDDIDNFTRGKLAGHIEVVLEIEELLFRKDEEDAEDGY